MLTSQPTLSSNSIYALPTKNMIILMIFEEGKPIKNKKKEKPILLMIKYHI